MLQFFDTLALTVKVSVSVWARAGAAIARASPPSITAMRTLRFMSAPNRGRHPTYQAYYEIPSLSDSRTARAPGPLLAAGALAIHRKPGLRSRRLEVDRCDHGIRVRGGRHVLAARHTAVHVDRPGRPARSRSNVVAVGRPRAPDRGAAGVLVELVR